MLIWAWSTGCGDPLTVHAACPRAAPGAAYRTCMLWHALSLTKGTTSQKLAICHQETT